MRPCQAPLVLDGEPQRHGHLNRSRGLVFMRRVPVLLEATGGFCTNGGDTKKAQRKAELDRPMGH